MCCVFVKVKEINYIFPQGSTQWKVVEGLLIYMSHLKQKIYKHNKRQGEDVKTHQTPESSVTERKVKLRGNTSKHS